MFTHRRNKWLLVILLVVPLLLLFVEHERRAFMLIGTWQVIEEGKTTDSSGNRMLEVFRPDGTGETILEFKGDQGTSPFIYKFGGLSRIEITSDSSICGTATVPIDDPCLASIQPVNRTNVLVGSFSLNGREIHFKPFVNQPGVPVTYWLKVFS